MADSEAASEAARALLRARWGNRVVSRAVATVLERSAELDPVQLLQLREVIDREDGTDE